MQLSTQSLLLIFFGGGWGSVSRYLLAQAISQQWQSAFPWGTLGVNVGGCFLIGVVLTCVEGKLLTQTQGLLLATGFCGGFTTFSSLIYENQLLWNDRDYNNFAILYPALSLTLGLIATTLGINLARRFC